MKRSEETIMYAKRLFMLVALVFAIMAGRLGAQQTSTADLNGDGNIDFEDLALLALQWLDTCGCEGKQCGDDGCGGSCGRCSVDQTCEDNQCVPIAGCDHSSFIPQGGQTAVDYGDMFYYNAESAPTAPRDILIFELRQSIGGPSAPGTYPIPNLNYAESSLCVLVYYDCNELDDCEKVFLANCGTMEIIYIGDSGNHFYGTIADVNLIEVVIDPDTFVSTPVPGGQTWCIYDYTFDATVQ
jgi:hypothetical protein